MSLNLSANETRVIGCLMEKSIITPDVYPLTLNALTNACNQKSSRDPVMSLSPGEVQHTVRELEARHLRALHEYRDAVEEDERGVSRRGFRLGRRIARRRTGGGGAQGSAAGDGGQ